MKYPLIVTCLLIAGNSFAQKYSQPVLERDFPDPTVISAEGKYYAYATNTSINGTPVHIQVASSSDMKNWKVEGDALPEKPVWADRDFWAPHVLYDTKLKKYVMFYSGESVDAKLGKCLGVAFSDKPQGPFIDKGTPLLCGESFINIDPFAFADPKSGKKLLYWGSGFKPVKVQELTDDWTAFKQGTVPKPLVWPGKEKNYDRLIEGAWVDFYKGAYYLYYSGDNCCGEKANYAVMVARSANPFGPFKTLGQDKGTGSSVILEKNDEWVAPGHNSIFSDEKGNKYIAFHAIPADKRRSQPGYSSRAFYISRIEYRNGWPVVLH